MFIENGFVKTKIHIMKMNSKQYWNFIVVHKHKIYIATKMCLTIIVSNYLM